MNRKLIVHNILLPLFPENKQLKKYWWHKLIKLLAIFVALSSVYTALWMVFLFYFMPKSWIDTPLYPQFYHLSYLFAYFPINFASFFSRFPVYGTIFHFFLPFPIIGPFVLVFVILAMFYFLPSALYRLAIFVAQRFYLKKVKIILAVIAIVLGSFIFSTWKYQQLIDEGTMIADEQCITVNPLIIARKNSYIDSMKIILASGSAEEYWTETNKYLDISKKYIAAEKAWLATQKSYLGNQNFNTYIPAYIRKASQAQYDSREAEMKATSAIVELFETYKNIDEEKQKILSNTIINETKKSNDANNEYNRLYDSSKGESDFREYFITIPQSKCPPENYNIPDVQDILNPQSIPTNSPLG